MKIMLGGSIPYLQSDVALLHVSMFKAAIKEPYLES